MKLYIKDLLIETILGVYESEKLRRKFKLSIEIEFDAGKSIYTDDIKDTLDYSILEERIVSFVKDKNYNLIEKLVYDIAILISEDKRVYSCLIKLEKNGCTKNSKSMLIEYKYIK